MPAFTMHASTVEHGRKTQTAGGQGVKAVQLCEAQSASLRSYQDMISGHGRTHICTAETQQRTDHLVISGRQDTGDRTIMLKLRQLELVGSPRPIPPSMYSVLCSVRSTLSQYDGRRFGKRLGGAELSPLPGLPGLRSTRAWLCSSA